VACSWKSSAMTETRPRFPGLRFRQLLRVVHRPDGINSIDPMARALCIWPGPQRARSGAHQRVHHY
jgi:hypothetical protein